MNLEYIRNTIEESDSTREELLEEYDEEIYECTKSRNRIVLTTGVMLLATGFVLTNEPTFTEITIYGLGSFGTMVGTYAMQQELDKLKYLRRVVIDSVVKGNEIVSQDASKILK